MELQITKCAIVSFRGDKHPESEAANLPMCRVDNGLVLEFLRWCGENNIYSIHGLSSGGGEYHACHWLEDLDKICTWFDDHNVEGVEIIKS